MEQLATALKMKSDNLRMDSVSAKHGQKQKSVKIHIIDHYESGECDQKKIRETFRQISTSKGNPLTPFVRQMGLMYHVRKVCGRWTLR